MFVFIIANYDVNTIGSSMHEYGSMNVVCSDRKAILPFDILFAFCGWS